ncbi:MAG TPA: hypothetical protein VEH49_07535, partial [Methylomirabilota bacterium]|nr:hypothetical protein [Methylomirabilota bacterium]
MTPVYGSSGPRRLAGFVLACAMAVPTSCRGDVPPEPRLAAETASAFARYLEQAEARNAGELRAGTPVFWIDGLPEKDRAAAYAALKRGEVKLRQLEVRDAAGKKLECPHGMIHHWAGVIFIPDANLEDALGLLEDYNQHAKYYSPDVERSQIETHDGDHFRVMMRFRRHKVVTVVLNTEQDINYFRDSPTRAHSRSSAVRIVQVENAGRKDERERPEGDDDGFLWRMETWWRMD